MIAPIFPANLESMALLSVALIDAFGAATRRAPKMLTPGCCPAALLMGGYFRRATRGHGFFGLEFRPSSAIAPSRLLTLSVV